jgi:hypothetical protein
MRLRANGVTKPPANELPMPKSHPTSTLEFAPVDSGASVVASVAADSAVGSEVVALVVAVWVVGGAGVERIKSDLPCVENWMI